MTLDLPDRYRLNNSSSLSIDALYWFLMFEPYMIYSLNTTKKWVNGNPRPQESLHGEFAWAHIDNNNVIIETNLQNDKDDEIFIIKKEVFARFLDDWKEIYLKLPKEVTIYYDGEQFTFDPVY